MIARSVMVVATNGKAHLILSKKIREVADVADDKSLSTQIKVLNPLVLKRGTTQSSFKTTTLQSAMTRIIDDKQ